MSVHIRKLAFWRTTPSPIQAGSVVIITGAASGIGLQIALVYSKRRTKLVLVDLNQDGLNKIVEQCKHNGSEAVPVKCDVTDYKQVSSMVETALSTYHHGIQGLVLCAGIGAHHLFSTMKSEELVMFEKLMKVNFYGYLNCVHAAYSHLCDSHGTLIAITSFSGEVGLPYRTAYCASKFAVTGFLESLRSEMAERQLTHHDNRTFDITIVCPPTVDTNLRANSLTIDPNLKHVESKHAMTVEECALAIVDAGDRRLRKAFFPLKSFLASYLRPIIPDIVDGMIWQRARL